MRIMWITNNYTPYKSGVAQALLALSPVLLELGHELSLITLDFLGKGHHNDPPWVTRVPSALRFIRHGNHIAIPLFPDRYIMDTIERYNPDIIHSHHPFLLGMSALKGAKKSGKPIVFTYHTIYEAYAYHVPLPSKIARTLITGLVKRYCGQVDAIIAPSKPLADKLQEAGFGNKVSIIPSGIRSTFFETDGERTTPVITGRLNLVTVGRFTPEKNIAFLIATCAQLPKALPYRLTIVGYGPQLDALRTLAYEKLRLNQTVVTFVEHPDEKTLMATYQSAHLFLFASQSDTQGLVLAEAMAQGVPVIALDGPGQSAIIEHGKNGFLVTSQEEMINCIQQCFADPVLYTTLRMYAQKTGVRYNPRNLVHDIITTYRSLIDHSK